MLHLNLAQYIHDNVAAALDEDIRGGDVTAQLIPRLQTATASIISRQTAVLKAWLFSPISNYAKCAGIRAPCSARNAAR